MGFDGLRREVVFQIFDVMGIELVRGLPVLSLLVLSHPPMEIHLFFNRESRNVLLSGYA